MRGTYAPPEGRYNFAETDANGNFKLLSHGRAIYFRRPDLQPLTKVMNYSARKIEVVLENVSGTWLVPACTDLIEYQRHPRDYAELSGIFLPLFVLRDKDIEIKKVKDIDYVAYYLGYGTKESRQWLQAWFGPNAVYLSTTERLLVKSSEFSERWARIGDGDASDIDMRGRFADGRQWRFIGLGGGSAIFYEDASPELAASFDGLLDNMCHQFHVLRK
jgi:hypothetical protein